MKLSKQLYQNTLVKPNNWENESTKKLIETLGLIGFVDSGFPYYSIFGKQLKNKIENAFAKEFMHQGFQEIEVPSIHNRKIVQDSGKYDLYKKEFIDIGDKYVLTSTSEEYLSALAKNGITSYKQLPIRLFELGNSVRLIQRPEGILKLKEFGGITLTSFNKDNQQFLESLSSFKEGAESLFSRFKIPYSTEQNEDSLEFFYELDNKKLSLGMAYKYDLSKLGQLTYKDNHNKSKEILLGTHGIGIERVLFSLLDSNKSNNGFNLPEEIIPYNGIIIPVKNNNALHKNFAEKIYELKKSEGYYLDDRDLSIKEKLDFADVYSIKNKILIGDNEINGKE